VSVMGLTRCYKTTVFLHLLCLKANVSVLQNFPKQNIKAVRLF